METRPISTQRWLVRNKFTDTDSNKAKRCRHKEVDGVRAGAGVVMTPEGEDQTTLFIVLMDLIHLFVSQTAAPGSPFSCDGEPSPTH